MSDKVYNNQEPFDFQEYLSRGVEHFVRDALKATLKNPRTSSFLIKFGASSRRASKYRKKQEETGEHIPPFIIASITGSCNLHCEGCYSRETHATCDDGQANEMTKEDWGRVFKEAVSMGISFIVLAGGEPLLRRDVIEEASKEKNILFPIFTNGTYIDRKYFELFNSSRNLVPVMSIEGKRELTDKRRGEGVYERVIKSMELFKNKGIIFGISVTVTKLNYKDATNEEFIKEMIEYGNSFLFLTEYVPVEGQGASIAPDDEEREYVRNRLMELRKKFSEMVFVNIPGDEKSSGGCLAAGRGFFHINAQGSAEPCPMSPYSDINVNDASLRAVLHSQLFRGLRDSGALKQDHTGGCVLASQAEKVKMMAL